MSLTDLSCVHARGSRHFCHRLLVVMVMRVIVVMGLTIVLVQCMAIAGNHAALIGNYAAHMLKLNRVVVEMKTVPQQRVQAPQDPVTLRRGHIINQHMAT